MVVMGIDGGGSTLRVVITDADLNIIGQSEGGTANPSVIGHEAAAQLIHKQIQVALESAGLAAAQIEAVAAGIAGASATHSADWLDKVLRPALPQALIVPSSDVEIALVGAHARREGILVLAGTGSVAYGINASGQAAQVGGWGYLIGDEGSGYWLGLQAIQAVTQAVDGRASETTLTEVILKTLALDMPRQLIAWLYRSETPRTPDIARLAPLVIAAAAVDPTARYILVHGAQALSDHVTALQQQLEMPNTAIALAGGLLDQPNPYALMLCEKLGLAEFPIAKYPPVMGAALLALMRSKNAA